MSERTLFLVETVVLPAGGGLPARWLASVIWPGTEAGTEAGSVGASGVRVWAVAPTRSSAVERLGERLVGFLEIFDQSESAALLVMAAADGSGDITLDSDVVEVPIYPLPRPYSRDLRELSHALRSLLQGEVPEGRVEVAEHRVAEGLKSLDEKERRLFLARLGRAILDEPALKAGAGLGEIDAFISWVRSRFAVEPF